MSHSGAYPVIEKNNGNHVGAQEISYMVAIFWLRQTSETLSSLRATKTEKLDDIYKRKQRSPTAFVSRTQKYDGTLWAQKGSSTQRWRTTLIQMER